MTIKFNTPTNIIIDYNATKYVKDFIKKLNAHKPLIITTKGRIKDGFIEKIISQNKISSVDVFDGVVCEPTTKSVISCVNYVKKGDYDLLIGIGGGSTIDTTKIASVMATNKGKINDFVGMDKIDNPGIKTLMIPTTAGSGSEVTNIAVLMDEKDEIKRSIVSRYLFPTVALVDPLLTVTLPKRITAYTGMDALTHAIESFVSKGSNIITDCISLEVVKIIFNNLENAVRNGNDINTRYNLSVGSLMAGIADTNAGVGAVHALAYPLESVYRTPHGISNTIMLPYVLRFNYNSNISKFNILKKIIGGDLIDSILKLITTIELPHSLAEINVKEEMLPNLAEKAMSYTRLLTNNPREIKIDDVLEIYKKALYGDYN